MDEVRVVGELGGTVPAGVVVALDFGQWANRAALLEEHKPPSDPWKATPDAKNPAAPLTRKRVDPEDAKRRRLFRTKSAVGFKRGEVVHIEDEGLSKVSRVNFENVTQAQLAAEAMAKLKASQAEEKAAAHAKVDADNAAKAAAKKPAKAASAEDPHSLSKPAGKK